MCAFIGTVWVYKDCIWWHLTDSPVSHVAPVVVERVGIRLYHYFNLIPFSIYMHFCVTSKLWAYCKSTQFPLVQKYNQPESVWSDQTCVGILAFMNGPIIDPKYGPDFVISH